MCCRILVICLCVQWDENHYSRLLLPKVFHQHSLDFDLNIYLTINHEFSIRYCSSVFVLNYCIFLIYILTYLSIDFPFNKQTISLLYHKRVKCNFRGGEQAQWKKQWRCLELALSCALGTTGVNPGGRVQEQYPCLQMNPLSILGWECKCLCSAVLHRYNCMSL